VADAETLLPPVPFDEAIGALRRRLGTLLPSDRWTETLGEINNWGFAVAGAKKESLLRSIGQSLVEADTAGRDVKWFQRQFAAIVAKEGWSFRGSYGWRSRVIFETNLGQSREAGKWARAAEAVRDGRQVWMRYVATMDGRTRPQHAAWNNTVLPPDHAWWRTHSPKNGWGCRCTVQLLSQDGLDRAGLKPSASAPAVNFEPRTINTEGGQRTVQVPAGIDTGFGHSPGQRWADQFTPRPMESPDGLAVARMLEGTAGGNESALPRIISSRPPPSDLRLPNPRVAAANRILPDDLTAEAYAQAFLEDFGATLDRPVTITDVVGSTLTIGRDFFITAAGTNTAAKQGRGPYLLLAADAIRQPDEVWAALELIEIDGVPKLRLVRRYIARFEAPDRTRSGFAVFENAGDAWGAVTAFDLRAEKSSAGGMEAALQKRRTGILIYKRSGQ